MHDTALEIGRLAIDIYGGSAPKILEVGSMDVNGSLRQFAPEDSEYLGVDLEAGEGVDMIVEAGKPFPFADACFDFILASSVFEHDPAFWATFLDLARLLKVGGHLYINAPSNGVVHRYPEDHWRFYPDSGMALERWANSQDLPMRLIESFTAPRKKDHWNDFVAVFRRGEQEGELSGRLLHSSFEGTNVWTMGAKQVLKPSAVTEDMQLLKAEREKAQGLEKQLAQASANAKDTANDMQVLQSTLRQREEEIAQTRRERDTAMVTNAKAEAVLAERDAQLKDLEIKIKRARSAKKTLKQKLLRSKEQIEAHRKEAVAALKSLREAEKSISERFDEIASLTRFLSEAEAAGRQAAEHREWLAEIHAQLAKSPKWWVLLPQAWRASRQLDLLRRASLFDGASYLNLYPDVASEGMDPLRHFILHGMKEGRRLTR